MNPLHLRIACRAGLTALALLCAVGASALAQAPAPAPIGTVKVTEGDIRVMRGGMPHLLKIGDVVFIEDRIVTAANQSVGITLRDNSRVSAGPNSIVVLQQFRFEPEAQSYGLVVQLLRGTLNFVSGLLTKLAPETVRIETPTATIAVRGTQLLVRAED